jgi:hypothetical protein
VRPREIIVDIKKTFAVLTVVAVARCQENLENESNVDEKKEKRGISLNLGQGLEGYSYLGPSSYSGRGSNYNRGYTPITEYGTKIDR